MRFRLCYMKFFDLHCDTIGECCKNKVSLRKNNLHISLEKAKNFESYTQVFAIWIPDELRKEKAVAYFNTVCDYYNSELLRNKDLVTCYNPLKQEEKRIKSILAVEGGAALGGTIDGLYHLTLRLVTARGLLFFNLCSFVFLFVLTITHTLFLSNTSENNV